ncbi:transcription-repair coupling factor, partial [Planctomycetota bacterium]
LTTTLCKVGSKKWQKQKDKVAASVQDLAAELLRLQAERQLSGGIAYDPDTHWQQEFEACFPYQETPDQLTALGEIKKDMERRVTMDRLLCGDVGYGKTELAMRAAFKTVENGKQVAILVPTTVLCVQHGRTFADRFADFPITIEVLNRFRTPKEAKDIVMRAKQGRVDVLIGTHRLISKDVGFKDLGLLIIDEEQRFGVEHKERLKRLRVDVDILTLSATPIPRTLHMALLGLRDISSLATPPVDRRSVVTTLVQYNRETIRKGILRELNRGGQVFFLHNRVHSIGRKAMELEKLLEGTDARIRIAHGQMSKRELEDAMIDFVRGQVDVLVCTTIIESGLDIPNANTIFIDNADRFGLAELHQLRGRVGRYHHRAYAYMLMPNNRTITPIAAKRLKAIEEYSQLGAGFRIALRDLEIRGAGNILGAEQSGHIQLVGYQMYCEMLADSVRLHKGEPVEALGQATVVDLGFQVVIPKNYIRSDRHRLDVYRRIAGARGAQGLTEIGAELTDVYGPIPDAVDWLLQLAEIRLAAGQYEINHIGIAGKCVTFAFAQPPDDRINGLFAKVRGTIRVPDPRTLYLELEPNYFEPPTLLRILRKLFRRKNC